MSKNSIYEGIEPLKPTWLRLSDLHVAIPVVITAIGPDRTSFDFSGDPYITYMLFLSLLISLGTGHLGCSGIKSLLSVDIHEALPTSAVFTAMTVHGPH
jgi:hypothetical protein